MDGKKKRTTGKAVGDNRQQTNIKLLPGTVARIEQHLKNNPVKYASKTHLIEAGVLVLMDLDDGILNDVAIIRSALLEAAQEVAPQSTGRGTVHISEIGRQDFELSNFVNKVTENYQQPVQEEV